MDEQPDRKWGVRLRWAGTIASLGLLAWLLSRQDWQALVRISAAVPWQRLVLAFVLVLVGQLWNATRWMALMSGLGIRPGMAATIRMAFSGLFASNFLPTTIGGDVVRIVGVVRHASDRVAGAATVFMDRAVSVVGMLFVVPFSWPLIRGLLGVPPPTPAAVAAGSALGRRVEGWLRRLTRALALWASRPHVLLVALLASWVGVVCYLAAVWLTAQSLGIPVSLADVAGATALTYFLTLLPISVNAYGLRELGMLALYVELGASAEQASALALITRALLMAVSLPGSLWLSGVMQGKTMSGSEGDSDAI